VRSWLISGEAAPFEFVELALQVLEAPLARPQQPVVLGAGDEAVLLPAQTRFERAESPSRACSSWARPRSSSVSGTDAAASATSRTARCATAFFWNPSRASAA